MARLNRSVSPLKATSHPIATGTTKARGRPPADPKRVASASIDKPARTRARGCSAPPTPTRPTIARVPTPPPPGPRRGRSRFRSSQTTSLHSILAKRSKTREIIDKYGDDDDDDERSESGLSCGYTDLIDELLATPNPNPSANRPSIQAPTGEQDISNRDSGGTAVVVKKKEAVLTTAEDTATWCENLTIDRALAALWAFCPLDGNICKLDPLELEQKVSMLFNNIAFKAFEFRKTIMVVPSISAHCGSSVLMVVFDTDRNELNTLRIGESSTPLQRTMCDDVYDNEMLMSKNSNTKTAQVKIYPTRQVLCPADSKGIILFAIGIHILSGQQEEIPEPIDHDLWGKVLTYCLSLNRNSEDKISDISALLLDHSAHDIEKSIPSTPSSSTTIPQLRAQQKSLKAVQKTFEHKTSSFKLVHHLFLSLHSTPPNPSDSHLPLPPQPTTATNHLLRLSDFHATLTSTISTHTTHFGSLMQDLGLPNYISAMQATLSASLRQSSLRAILRVFDHVGRELDRLAEELRQREEKVKRLLRERKVELEQEVEAAKLRLREFEDENEEDEMDVEVSEETDSRD